MKNSYKYIRNTLGFLLIGAILYIALERIYIDFIKKDNTCKNANVSLFNDPIFRKNNGLPIINTDNFKSDKKRKSFNYSAKSRKKGIHKLEYFCFSQSELDSYMIDEETLLKVRYFYGNKKVEFFYDNESKFEARDISSKKAYEIISTIDKHISFDTYFYGIHLDSLSSDVKWIY